MNNNILDNLSEKLPQKIAEYIKENSNTLLWRLRYGTGNGYLCSCCRYESEDIKDFDSLEELFKYVACRSFENIGDVIKTTDFWVIDITLIFPPMDTDSSFLSEDYQKYIDIEKNKLELEIANRKKQEEKKKKAQKKKDEQKEKELFLKLKKKYEKSNE